MPGKCKWPTCKANADGNKIYCIPHDRIYGDSVEVKLEQPIAKESQKEKALKKPRKVRYAEFIKRFPMCYAKFSKDCQKVASVIHHLKGRTPAVVDDERFWMACCPVCNSEIEARHKDAEEKGLKISQHKISPVENQPLKVSDAVASKVERNGRKKSNVNHQS